jgi:DNA-binding NarL/FixJ family response regulator
MRDLLDSHESWEVCAEAATGRQAVELTVKTRPDIVVLDLSMPELDGLQAAQEIHVRFPKTIMLILTAHDTFGLSDVAKAVGVRTCLSKVNLDLLVEAIEDILQETLIASDQAPTAVGKRAVVRKV